MGFLETIPAIHTWGSNPPRSRLRAGTTCWHLCTTFGFPGWRHWTVAAIPGMSGWLEPISWAQSKVERAGERCGLRNLPSPSPSANSLQGITYTQSHCSRSAWLQGGEGPSVLTYSAASQCRVLSAPLTCVLLSLLSAQICLCLSTESKTRVCKRHAGWAGHLFRFSLSLCKIKIP